MERGAAWKGQKGPHILQIAPLPPLKIPAHQSVPFTHPLLSAPSFSLLPQAEIDLRLRAPPQGTPPHPHLLPVDKSTAVHCKPRDRTSVRRDLPPLLSASARPFSLCLQSEAQISFQVCKSCIRVLPSSTFTVSLVGSDPQLSQPLPLAPVIQCTCLHSSPASSYPASSSPAASPLQCDTLFSPRRLRCLASAASLGMQVARHRRSSSSRDGATGPLAFFPELAPSSPTRHLAAALLVCMHNRAIRIPSVEKRYYVHTNARSRDLYTLHEAVPYRTCSTNMPVS